MLKTQLKELYERRGSQQNIKQLCELLGHPEKKFPSIHVAGTNGKGSVATKIAEGLRLAGYKTGLFTSPHIECFNERITINGAEINDQTLESLLSELMPYEGSFFEITTAAALAYFAQEEVDYAVVEVGMGGRLDATNVVDSIVTIITSIALEHTQVLGDTVEAIAKEKAGIRKEGVPMIVGPTVPKCIAADYRLDGPFPSFEEENQALATKALELLHVDKRLIEEAIQKRAPFRMEIISESPFIVLDVSHNPAAFAKLFEALPRQQYHVVLALAEDKDKEGCLEVIRPFAKSIEFIKIEDICKLKKKEPLVISGSFRVIRQARQVLTEPFLEPTAEEHLDLQRNQKQLQP